MRELKDIGEALADKQQRLAQLKEQTALARVELHAHRLDLAAQVRISYSLGRQDPIKLLLNLDDIADVNRSLSYQMLSQQRRLRQVSETKQSLLKLGELKRRAAATTAEFSALRSRRQQSLDELESRKAERAELVEALKNKLEAGATELELLRDNESALVALLEDLRQELSEMPMPAAQTKPFAELRGILSWPTAGDTLNRFGTPRPEGNLKWQGVLIGAQAGAPVHSVSHGRVAFANWLRGFGLLLIIDHGDGYMSLYGRNASLFKEVGEWVNTGEQISVVAAADVDGRSALYFEIRRDGIPQNPAKWCKQPSLASG